MATPEQRRAWNEQAEKERRAARMAAAKKCGHEEWAKLPETRRMARMMKRDQYFTGRKCPQCSRYSPRETVTDRCLSCKDGFVRRHKPETLTVAHRFARMADLIESTGRLHRMGLNKVIRKTDVVVDPAGARAACEEAGRRSERTGRLHVVVHQRGRWVVRERRENAT
ncbi:hypothetical protein [Roseinatronobacter sp. S2]|uniref:hypothetical protein n=1 Tax=Roseinatronobacter sp. S2 TaxID=3035471 RepID=UPI0024102644|nr:hypothetical protein [Roseinatronobacter sp. S2]WFE74256.1 hypothetical protein P8S53_13850 [Roseinatronobacter sp. S2]